jgi:hypothetical protein
MEKGKGFLLHGSYSCTPAQFAVRSRPSSAPLSPTATSGPRGPCGPTGQGPLSLRGPTCRDFLPPNSPPLLHVCWCPLANPSLSLSHPVPSPATCRRCCSSCRFACAHYSTDLLPPKLRCHLALLCQPPAAMAAVSPGCPELRS